MSEKNINYYLVCNEKGEYMLCGTVGQDFSPPIETTHVFKLPKDPNDIKVRIEL